MFHFCIADTEHDWRPGTEQYSFIEHCLSSVDRQKQPWLIFLAHRVLGYSSADFYGDEGTSEEPMGRESLQELWQKYKVDIAFFGHVHNYERTCPVYQVHILQPALWHQIYVTSSIRWTPRACSCLSVAEHLHTERIELLQWPLRSNHTCSCRRWRCQPCWLHHGPSEMELLSRPWLRVRKAHSLQPFDAATRVQKEQRWKGLRSLHHLPGLPWCSRLCRWQLLKNNPGFLNMATEAASISTEEKSSVIMVDTHLCRMLIDSSMVIQNSYCSGKQKSQSKDLVILNPDATSPSAS